MFKVLYVPNTNYKDIVFAFKSNGVMSEQLFDMIEAGSAKELQEMQTSNSVKAVNEDILRTLVAVKILNDNFKDKKALWQLVEKKAIDHCKKNLKVSNQALMVMLQEVVTSFNANPLACKKD